MEKTTMSNPQAPVPFLHRRSAHVFITTEDPRYRYEWVCSHCDYPVTPDDDCCPRCQRALEECPVCSCLRHVRVPCVKPDAQGGRLCLSCGVRRVPFGDLALQSVEGSFCTNLYGCPAGGLLLRTGEYAVLPKDASLCPLCRDAELKPLPVPTFVYHITHCLFCSTFYQSKGTWNANWTNESDIIGEIGKPSGPPLGDCVLCGRQDRLDGADSGGERGREGADASATGAGAEGDARRALAPGATWRARLSDGFEEDRCANEAEYLRMAELARILALEPTMKTAFPRVFKAWFGTPSNIGLPDDGPAIHTVVALLLEGTRQSAPRRLLQRRIGEFLEALAPHFPGGPNYHIRPQGDPRPFYPRPPRQR